MHPLQLLNVHVLGGQLRVYIIIIYIYKPDNCNMYIYIYNCGVIRSFYSIADVAGYNSRRRLSLHIATAAQHPFTSSLSDISSQATLQSPGFENENLDRPKPGMLIANMLCTFVQIPHHNLVPFFQHSKSMTFFLWSIGINLYHNKAHISKLSRF